MTADNGAVYVFGPYRLNVDARLLTREHQPVALAPKTFDLLLLLVRRAGQALSKQELLTELWPDTFVEEGNLSFQISTLRKALGQTAHPWIETVPKHGYRFAVEVTTAPPPAHRPQTEVSSPAAPAPRPRAAGGRWVAAGLLAVAIVAMAYAAHVRRRPIKSPDNSARSGTPLTAYAGAEVVPSLNPDGSQVAFSWDGPRQDNQDIYVKLVGPGEPVRLTTDPARDDKPAWSPDGRRIAFLRFSASYRADVFVVPALGGAERRVGSIMASPTVRPMSDLAWTPDGTWLAVSARASAGEPAGIWLLQADGPERRRLTTAAPLSTTPDAALWDLSPAFSADGRRMAFIRETAIAINAIYVLPLSPEGTPAGPPVKVLGDPQRGALGLAWTPGDRALVFASGGHLGMSRLHRVPLAPGTSVPLGSPELLPFGEQATAVSIARTGRLVYSAQFRDTEFRTLSLVHPTGGPGFSRLAPSTFDEETPDYSPDGQWLVFASTRSGAEEIRMARADGSNPQQMTSMGGPQCANPQWSPDGTRVLFNSRAKGSADLYVMRPATGDLTRLTSDPLEEVEARWSRDGRSIYFGSNKTGRLEVWSMPSDGGTPRQITHGGGTAASESPDGRYLYYAKGLPSAIGACRCQAATRRSSSTG